MEIFQNMNQKLAQGWNMTNGSCPICKSIVMFNPKDNSYFCIKCKKPVQFQQQNHQQNEEQQQQQLYYNTLIQSNKYTPSKPSKSDEVSKKMGEKLLQGWAMLQQACLQCNVPLMKSKKGQKICYGCNKDYQAVDKKVQVQKIVKQQKKIQKQIVNEIVRPNNTIIKQRQVQRRVSGSLNGKIQQILLKSVQFYNKRIQTAILNNNQTQVNSIIQKLKQIVTLSKSIN